MGLIFFAIVLDITWLGLEGIKQYMWALRFHFSGDIYREVQRSFKTGWNFVHSRGHDVQLYYVDSKLAGEGTERLK